MPSLPPDAVLLAEVPEDILCFSRSFEDLTCFWDEEEASGIHRFYYWYSRDAPTICAVSTQRRGANGMRHICVFPSQDVRLFTQLHVLVLDAATNRTRHRRELSVDAVGLIAPPVNISAHWAGATGQLRVSWQPPLADYPSFFLYEVCYHPMTPTVTPRGTAPGDLPAHPTNGAHPPTARGAASSQGTGQGLVQADTWVILRELQPGVKYHIQVRSKPDGTSMDGVWGPWSEVVVAETPHSSGDIGLHCSTPDLRCVRCVWSWDPAEQHSTHELFYRASPSGAGMRDEMWQQCEEASVGTQGRHTCTFQPTAGSPIAVLVNITRLHDPPVLSYFKEPFWLHQAGESLHSTSVARGRVPSHGSDTSPPRSAHGGPAGRAGDGGTGPAHLAVAAAPGSAGGATGVPDSLRHGRQPRLEGAAGPAGGQERSAGPPARCPLSCPGADAARWAAVPGQLERVVPARRGRCRGRSGLGDPERDGGTADLHRSAAGAAVHLPVPVQREAEAVAARPRPAPRAGHLPARQPQAGPALRLLQAAAGGRRAALPAGGAARTPRRARGSSARTRCQPPGAQHGHRQPLLPADGRLGAAWSALGPFSPWDVKYRP
ncbi:thrombopoietin receptor isoform X2 [Lagopus leucura]|uniref:thrombopoietin receptor isoform X2 n=1 Tax=Lagopus leucura TaxID=30410 RepID=UPI001C674578|nr:thrombopoietin receptor isoform X2 [Lagopus leucura]